MAVVVWWVPGTAALVVGSWSDALAIDTLVVMVHVGIDIRHHPLEKQRGIPVLAPQRPSPNAPRALCSLEFRP